MKKVFYLITALASFGSFTAMAQDINKSQVPSIVKNNFAKAHPDATDVEWEYDGVNYIVEFDTGFYTPDHEIWFDASGTEKRHKTEWNPKNLPSAVKTTVKSKYDGYRIEDADKLTADNNTTYLVEIEKANEERKLVISSDGNVISDMLD